MFEFTSDPRHQRQLRRQPLNREGPHPRKSCQRWAQLNHDPSIKDAFNHDQLLTENQDVCDEEESLIQQHGRKFENHRPRRTTASCEIAVESDAIQSRGSQLRCSKELQIFVANVPKSMTENYVKETFSRFGTVVDVTIVSRNINSQPFAYVTFKDAAAASRVLNMEEVPSVQDRNHVFRVEPRKSFGTARHASVFHHPKIAMKNGHEPLVQSPSAHPCPPGPVMTYAGAILSNLNPSQRQRQPLNEWKSALENFDWKPCAARYLFRTVTMEMYLLEYVHTQASYREIKRESLTELAKRLDSFCGQKPTDVVEMMPPSVSGVVYNKSRESGDEIKFTDQLAKMLTSDCISVEDGNVHYLHCLSPSLARQKLKEMLVEGLFVYFFAKFCHGPRFKIRFAFYQRSEPIKSSVIAVTGVNEINQAIVTYFEMYKDIFVFDSSTYDLTMSKDYFDKACKEDMRPYLNAPSHTRPALPSASPPMPVPSCQLIVPEYSLFGPQQLPEFKITSLFRAPTSHGQPIGPPMGTGHPEAQPHQRDASFNESDPQHLLFHDDMQSLSPDCRCVEKMSVCGNDSITNSNATEEDVESERNYGVQVEEEEEPSEYFNASGYIKKIGNDSRGQLLFYPDDGWTEPLLAFFKRKDTYVEGKRLTANLSMKNFFMPGDQVCFNATVGKRARWTCSHVWKGKTPMFIEKMIVSRDAAAAAAAAGGEDKRETSFEAAAAEVENGNWQSLKGKVRAIVKKRSGFIMFHRGDRVHDAYFTRDNFYNHDGAMFVDDLNAVLRQGQSVMMDVERQTPQRGVSFRATLVWNAGQPRPSDRPLEREALSRHIDLLLEPVEVTEDIKLQPYTMPIKRFAVDGEHSDLPRSVESVVHGVLREDHGHNILSNPLAIDGVLNQMEEAASRKSGKPPLERGIIKLRIEREVRSLLSTLLADHYK